MKSAMRYGYAKADNVLHPPAMDLHAEPSPLCPFGRTAITAWIFANNFMTPTAGRK
jgi:hypothetical protein